MFIKKCNKIVFKADTWKVFMSATNVNVYLKQAYAKHSNWYFINLVGASEASHCEVLKLKHPLGDSV